MPTVGQRERFTQQLVLRFFQDELGYRYLGDWKDRDGNRNVEQDLLRGRVMRSGPSTAPCVCWTREMASHGD